MTFEKYKEWLDDQIDDNDRRMEESDDEMGSYYLGCATAFTVAKEKFIAINLVSPSPAPTVEGRERYSWEEVMDGPRNKIAPGIPADKFVEEERDLFAMSFLVFALFDPRAQALIQAKSPTGAILRLYKDRAYIDEDPTKQ